MMFYKKTIYSLLLLAIGNGAFAQLSTGSDGLFIMSGTTVSSDGLVLQPSTDLTISSTTIEKSGIAVSSSNGNSINRVYTFSSPITFTGNIGLYYLDEELNGNTASLLSILYKKNPTGYVTTTNNNIDLANKLVTQSINNVSMLLLTAINSYVTLPVEVKNFAAAAVNNHVKLTWETLSEKDHDYFEVERSTNGKTFTSLTKIKGEINVNAKAYETFDYSPAFGDNYYRLLQYDKDGKKTDFGTRNVKFKLSEDVAIKIFPNPIAREINIKLNNGKQEDLEVSLFTLSGQLIHQEQIKAKDDTYFLLLNKKPASGLYLLKVKGKSINHSAKVLVL
ncbi:T9SS type A sorting domain-containing protein [Pedobacter sp. ASV28]|uniref:T9SS type A sorting domain-containing protein n=1 Tax=Pedobacter sp. ASV28 TaxID=2795123 RepID=UPI0018EDB12C|nr:T9SS type A sorting domain-containing protein [Pedobacter sp. ASV28]